jgi:hypothetical protein
MYGYIAVCERKSRGVLGITSYRGCRDHAFKWREFFKEFERIELLMAA